MQNLLNDLTKLFQKDERIFADGKLLKNKLTELALKLDESLIELLLSDDKAKKHFFIEKNIKKEKVLVFDKDKFIAFVNNKEFLPDSFTSFKNKIGLMTNGDYIKEKDDVVLAWAYKDCVLEGGQDKEDQKRDEIFYNETLSPDEVDRLFEPKVLTNFKKYDSKGEHKVTGFNADDSLIIKGNNLLALHCLKQQFRGRVKLIYIDPPYNTDGPDDYFQYNDSFNHSTWLAFMRNRLEIARDLLSNDGAIYVQLDYNEVHYCKILLDEIFRRENFQREIIWRIGWVSGYKSADKNWIRNHDSILFYSKDKTQLKFNKKYIPYPKDYVRRDGAKPDGGGYPYEDTWNCNELDPLNSIAIVSYSKEKVGDFKGQKNEALIQRIVEAHTKENDLVLDFFAGSGTTASVSLKLKRRFICIEQIDRQIKKQIMRLKTTIAGDQIGISKAINWKGGGSFVYAELMKWNEQYMTEIKDADSSRMLLNVYEKMKKEAFFRYDIYLSKFEEKKFEKLPLKEQKQVLCECLDKNHLYVNLSDIDDATYKVSADDKKLNVEFYKTVL